MSVEKVFLDIVTKRMLEYKALGDKTFDQVSGEDMNWQPNEASNSMAMIIQHMHGNMLSRWTNFLTEDGEKDWRKRDEEFEEQHLPKEQLLQLWEKGWETFLVAISDLTPADLLKTITIRLQPLTVMDAINRQIAHYSYHVGQIVYLGRWIKNKEWTSLSIPKKQSRH